jgi:hypothetical protein
MPSEFVIILAVQNILFFYYHLFIVIFAIAKHNKNLKKQKIFFVRILLQILEGYYEKSY